MAKQSEARSGPDAKPPVLAEPLSSQVDPSRLPEQVLSAADGRTEAQAERLGDPRLQTAQRQALAARVRRVHGNRHLQRVVALLNGAGSSIQLLQVAPDRVVQREDGETPEAEAEPADPEEEALQAFLGRGMMPDDDGVDVIGAEGRGGFTAQFDPDSRTLIASVNVGITFHHALSIDPATGVVTANTAGLPARDGATLRTLAARVSSGFPDVADRINEVNTNWRWSPDEEDPWMQDYRNVVTSAWSGQHYFQSARWSELLASVRVVVNVHKGDREGDHCGARIVKSPPSGFTSARVSYGSGTEARDQGLVMSSSGVRPSTTNFLRYGLQFENDSADIETAVGTVHSNDPGPIYLNKFIVDFEAASPDAGAPIQITGRASSTGRREYNQRLSEQRARNVENYLVSHDLVGSIDRVSSTAEGEEGATEEASWRRVEIVVGSGEAQITAAHEFGHMIGLGDEYSSPAEGFYPGAGTPVAVGDPAGHNALANAMGDDVSGAVAENTDNIMSVGNTVRPQHYATFHKAIEEATGESWQYGGASRGRVLPAVGGPAAGPAEGTAVA